MCADENKHGDRKEDEGVDTLEKASELEEWHNEAARAVIVASGWEG